MDQQGLQPLHHPTKEPVQAKVPAKDRLARRKAHQPNLPAPRQGLHLDRRHGQQDRQQSQLDHTAGLPGHIADRQGHITGRHQADPIQGLQDTHQEDHQAHTADHHPDRHAAIPVPPEAAHHTAGKLL